MASAFGGQRSIQLSYGCLGGKRLAKAAALRQPFRSRPLMLARFHRLGLISFTGWNCPRPQLAPWVIGGSVSTVMVSTEQSWPIEVL